jgi:hypothetical protein
MFLSCSTDSQKGTTMTDAEFSTAVDTLSGALGGIVAGGRALTTAETIEFGQELDTLYTQAETRAGARAAACRMTLDRLIRLLFAIADDDLVEAAEPFAAENFDAMLDGELA